MVADMPVPEKSNYFYSGLSENSWMAAKKGESTDANLLRVGKIAPGHRGIPIVMNSFLFGRRD